MTRLEARVGESLSSQRADKAIARLFPDLPSFRIREAFEKKDVKCNGRRIQPDTVVMTGDLLCLYVHLPDAPALDIVFEDAQYLVVSKRQGIAVRQADGNCVEALCEKHTGDKVFACHRLDVQTGGLLLLAKSESAWETAKEAFAQRSVQKTYRALVCGCPSPKEAALRAYLRKDASAARVYVTDGPMRGALPIETRYRVLETDGDISRIEVDLITGRTHQIRAHLAYIGHPVLGDDKYGNRAVNRARGVRRQQLWATRLVLWDGREFTSKENF